MKAVLTTAAALLLSLAPAGCRDASGDASRAKMTEPTFAATTTSSGATFHLQGTVAMDSTLWFTTDASGVSTFGEVAVFASRDTLKSVFLIYFVGQFDQSGNQTFCAAGGGAIPPSDFHLLGNGSTLSTTVSDNSVFSIFCGPPGLIDVRLRATPLFSGTSFTNSTSTFSVAGFGSTTVHSVGSSSQSSATATGSVLGFLIPATSVSSVGEGRNMQLDISHP
jgi:hypothetical protein